MPKALPFSQIQDGLPIWTVEVDDPQAAQEHPADLHLRRIALPGGEILALALRIYDVARKPHLHHLAGPMERPELRAWVQALLAKGAVGLVLQRSGWASSFERKLRALPAELSTLSEPPRPGSDPEGAIRAYLERYREALPRLGQPEAVWDEMSAASLAPKQRSPAWLWILLLLAAIAAGLAWTRLR